MSDRILIVDDDVDSLRLIGLMLQRQGYDIVAASNGAQALEKVSQEVPALVILDVMMPDMNGYEVARQLRSSPQTANIPIMMFTAKGTVDDKVAGFEAGADDYLTKPVHPLELASRVKVLLSRSAPQPSTGTSEPGQIASFVGVKGGVGTTTLALNAAVAMAQMRDGSRVALAEMRPGQGSLGLMLGHPNSQALGRLLSKGAKGLTPQEIEMVLEPHPSGVYLLMASSTPSPDEENFSPEMAEILVRNLAETANYVLLDLGHGLTPVSRRLVTISKQVIVCLEPHRMAVRMAEQILEELNALGLGPLRINIVLVNRTPSSLQMSWQNVQQALQKELMAIVSPAPESAYQALEHEKPMLQIQPDGITANQLRKLGEDLIALMGPVSEPTA